MKNPNPKGRPRGDRTVAINMKIRPELKELLDKYHQETGVNKTFVIEKALEEYFKNIKFSM